jgi:hypothetical protein
MLVANQLRNQIAVKLRTLERPSRFLQGTWRVFLPPQRIGAPVSRIQLLSASIAPHVAAIVVSGTLMGNQSGHTKAKEALQAGRASFLKN